MKRKLLCITIIMIIIALIPTKTTAHDFFKDNKTLGLITEDLYEQNKDNDSTIIEKIEEELAPKEETTKETIEIVTEENKEQFYENEIVEDEHEFVETIEETTNNNRTNIFDEYLGRFKIPSVGINVGCYASNSQKTVDAIDSAAYYYGYGHTIIADHNNQGFNAIKSCKVGTKATIETDSKIENLTCVGIIQGHNNGVILTDKNGDSIEDLYPGAVACYTCNDNWQNITIVFFMPDYKLENKNNNAQNETKNEQEESIIYDCKNGNHKWQEPKFEWGGELSDGRKFHWESIVCRICQDENWNIIYE